MSQSFSDKTALIECLYNDWIKNGKDSVISRYYREKKEKEINGYLENDKLTAASLSRIKDKYVRLSVAKRRYEANKDTPEEEDCLRQYLDIFLRLKIRKKTNKRGKFTKEAPEKYKCLTDRSKGLKDRYETIKVSVDEAVTGLLNSLFRGEITDFFYREGFYSKTDPKEKVTESLRREIKRKNANIDVIELLSFYQNTSESQAWQDSISGEDLLYREEFIKECLNILNQLRKTRNKEVYVPLYISNDTGAILCILGSDYCNKHDKENACYPCILSMMDIKRNDDPNANYDIDDADLISTLLVMNRKEFDTMIPAVEEFRRMNSIVSESGYYEGYREKNTSAIGVDKGRFVRYFDPDPVFGDADIEEDIRVIEDYDAREQKDLMSREKKKSGSKRKKEGR